jgi:hypothetical protein
MLALLLLACSGSPYEDCKACCWTTHDGHDVEVQDVAAGDACRAACVEDVRSCEPGVAP